MCVYGIKEQHQRKGPGQGCARGEDWLTVREEEGGREEGMRASPGRHVGGHH